MTNLAQVQARINDLCNMLAQHNRQYHQLDTPLISDAEYDALLQELRTLETDFPQFVHPHSPTQTVGFAAAKKFAPSRHSVPMMSLTNALTQEQVSEFNARVKKMCQLDQQNISYVGEPKIDGIAINLLYENKRLVKATTRGDGIVGENVTDNVKTIRSIPHTITGSCPRLFEVRGEIYMTKKEFIRLNQLAEQRGERLFINPRNAAAGSLRMLDPNVTAQRQLAVHMYRLVPVESSDIWHTHSDSMVALCNWGFPCVDEWEKVDGIAQCYAYYKRIMQQRDELPYEIDGVVIKVDSVEWQNKLGYTDHSPRWAIAWKFPATPCETILKSIDFQVSRNGILTPVARLQPVFIDGATVSNATLHNIDFIKRLGLRLDDRVLVVRSGGVIPKIERVVQHSDEGKDITIPTTCPICHSPLVHVENDCHYRCIGGMTCLAQRQNTLVHFVSRHGMNIRSLGAKTIQLLDQAQLMTSVADIYHLHHKREKLLNLPGLGEKKVDEIFRAIEASRSQPLPQVIYALGIPGVGRKLAHDIAQYFPRLELLSHADIPTLHAANSDKIGLGPITAQHIYDFFHAEANRDTIDALCAGLNTPPMPMTKHDSDSFFAGKKVVISGKFAGFPRTELQEKLKQLGAQVTSAVSVRTDFLICGEGSGKKLADARRLRVQVIDENELQSFLGA